MNYKEFLIQEILSSKGLSTNKHDCYKKEFGCQRGCTSYCYSDSANKFEAKLKNILINLWKECFVNN